LVLAVSAGAFAAEKKDKGPKVINFEDDTIQGPDKVRDKEHSKKKS
jgi:hypothetical protein